MATQCAVVNYVYLSFRSFLLKPVYLIVYPGLYLGNRFLDERRYLLIQTQYHDFYFELLTYCHYGNTGCGVFKRGGTKLERFLHKNQVIKKFEK